MEPRVVRPSRLSPPDWRRSGNAVPYTKSKREGRDSSESAANITAMNLISLKWSTMPTPKAYRGLSLTVLAVFRHCEKPSATTQSAVRPRMPRPLWTPMVRCASLSGRTPKPTTAAHEKRNISSAMILYRALWNASPVSVCHPNEVHMP
jgi:hypothetical protein